MKRVILLLIFTLSINIYAQSNHPKFHIQQYTPDSISANDIQKKMNTGWLGSTQINSGKNLTQSIKNQKPKNNVELIDSSYSWVWNIDSLHVWSLFGKETYTYDVNGNNISYCKQGGFSLPGIEKRIYTYDDNNNQTSYTKQSWSNNNEWINEWQCFYTYGVNNNLISFLDQHWINGVWDQKEIEIYTFDSNNNMTLKLFQKFVDTAWVSYRQESRIYDTNNNITSYLVQQSISGAPIENISKIINTYNSNNNLLCQTSQFWNAGAWVNGSQDLYTYDTNFNQTSATHQHFNGSLWINQIRYIYTYNSNNLMINKLYQHKPDTSTDTTLINSDLYSYTYDSNNNLMLLLSEVWFGSGWGGVRKYDYLYDDHNNRKYVLEQNVMNGSWVNTSRTNYTFDDSNNKTSFLSETWVSNTWSTTYFGHYLYNGNNNMISSWVCEDDSSYYYYSSSLPDSAGIIAGDTIVNLGQSGVAYSVPVINNATSYIWTLPDGATGSSSTNTILVNYGIAATSGNITVKGHNSFGDGAIFSLPIEVISTENISNFDQNNLAMIYPNPIENELIIELKGNSKSVNFKIINCMGLVIHKGKVADRTVVNTSGYISGIYIVVLENGKTFEYEKVIKK